MASRGKNFTEREKCILLTLIQKYKHIIENKCTNAVFTEKKKDAWEKLTVKYNSVAEVPRTSKQLNTAYLNFKRSTRQNNANEYVKKYLEVKHNVTTSDDEGDMDKSSTPNDITELHDVLIQLKKDEIADKNSMATDSGTYVPLLSNAGGQMSTVMGEQVKPLTNSSDSASDYFKNDDVTDCEKEVLQPQNSCDGFGSTGNTNFVPQFDFGEKRRIQKRKRSQISNENLKKQYYIKKVQCAIIERKTKIIEYNTALKKSKILDLELRKKQKEFDELK